MAPSIPLAGRRSATSGTVASTCRRRVGPVYGGE